MYNKTNIFKSKLLKMIFLNNPIKVSLLIIICSTLYSTKPNYLDHKHQVTKLYQNNKNQNKGGLCPFGYDTKNHLGLKLDLFDVYDVGVFSFAIYEHELISVGLFGKVFNIPPKLYS